MGKKKEAHKRKAKCAKCNETILAHCSNCDTHKVIRYADKKMGNDWLYCKTCKFETHSIHCENCLTQNSISLFQNSFALITNFIGIIIILVMILGMHIVGEIITYLAVGIVDDYAEVSDEDSVKIFFEQAIEARKNKNYSQALKMYISVIINSPNESNMATAAKREISDIKTILSQKGYEKERTTLLISKLLMSKGHDLGAKLKNGETVLMMALEESNIELAKLLISEGVNLNAKTQSDRTALMIASKKGHAEIARLLISKGADPNAKDINHKTVLMVALENGHTEIAKLLISKGADYNEKSMYGRTTLSIALEKNNLEMAELLILRGVNFKIRTSALIIASEKGNMEIVKLLISKGVDLRAENMFGKTALIMAAENGHMEIVKLLRSKEADFDTNKNK